MLLDTAFRRRFVAFITVPAVTELRAVALLSNATLGVLFFACAVMLATVTWSGSWSYPWYVIGEVPDDSPAWYFGFALGHFGMVGLSLRYLALGRLGRFVTLTLSMFFVLRSFNSAVTLTKTGSYEAWTLLSMPILIGIKWLLALGYMACSHMLMRVRGL